MLEISFPLCRAVKCIEKAYLCNHDDNCGDGSDETEQLCADHTCDPAAFVCSNGRCIAPRWRCDFDDDCGDNSDELGCGEMLFKNYRLHNSECAITAMSSKQRHGVVNIR